MADFESFHNSKLYGLLCCGTLKVATNLISFYLYPQAAFEITFALVAYVTVVCQHFINIEKN